MTHASIFSKARNSLARFRRADGGNIAVLFGIAIVPILASVGAAVDYARVNSSRTAMQAALDTAALMISKDVTSSMTAGEINQKAQVYFSSLYNRPEAKNLVVNATYTNSTSQGSKIVMTGSATMTTDFMNVVGFPTLEFGATSTTVWGTTKLRVALALDNTGSMSNSGKMTELKKAAKGLIDTLKTAAKQDGDVYISIVPFAKDVNIGKSFQNANWLRWDWWDAANRTCTAQNYWGQCTAYQPKNHNTWNGCVTDREESYDTMSTAPYSLSATATNLQQRATQFGPEQYDSCPEQILPLTYDWTALKKKIDDMSPLGGTNQSIGMAWGWLSLLQQEPFNAPAEDPNFKYNKVIILLSDGDNTQYRDPSYGNGQIQFNGKIDARQRLLCTNAKNAGIQIFTIQVNTNNDNNSSVMSDCASSTSTYFSTTSSSGINTAFQQIGGTLSKLRIAK